MAAPITAQCLEQIGNGGRRNCDETSSATTTLTIDWYVRDGLYCGTGNIKILKR
jgi:hypothetical protein